MDPVYKSQMYIQYMRFKVTIYVRIVEFNMFIDIIGLLKNINIILFRKLWQHYASVKISFLDYTLNI